MEKTNRLKKIAGIAVAVLLAAAAIVAVVGFSTYTQKWEGSYYRNGTWQKAELKIKDTRFHQWFGPFEPKVKITAENGEELMESPFVGNSKKLFSASWLKQEQERHGWNYLIDHALMDYRDPELRAHRTGYLFFSEPDFSENLLMLFWESELQRHKGLEIPEAYEGTIVFLSDKAPDTFLSETFESMETMDYGPAPDELELVKQAPRGN